MIDVSQKSIVVTGGASGIGAAVCTAAIEQGAYIGVIDIDEDAGRTICGKLGDKAFFAAGNVESESSMNEAISKLSSDMPNFNGAVCCAGVMPTREPIVEAPLENFDRVLKNHLNGTFLTCKLLGKKMLQHGGGSIVTIFSSSNKARSSSCLWCRKSRNC